jgi:anti-sigma B factor antagonist
MFPESADHLEVIAARVEDIVTVTVRGEIDLATSTRLNRDLDAALELQPPLARLRIDLTDVTFMDTTGVAVLLKARRRALELGARFSVSSSSPALTRLFEITGLTALLADD